MSDIEDPFRSASRRKQLSIKQDADSVRKVDSASKIQPKTGFSFPHGNMVGKDSRPKRVGFRW